MRYSMGMTHIETSTLADIKARLNSYVLQADSQIDLAEAALNISRYVYPIDDVAEAMQKLDHYAAAVEHMLPAGASVAETCNVLNKYLFGQLGLHGSVDNYSAPDNSYLNRVLDTGEGIPITLSIIYMEVARRLGLSVSGVTFPGHFLVKLKDGGVEQVLDPFAGGRQLTSAELNQRLRDLYGKDAPTVESDPSLLRAARKREILVRLLRNLKNIYMEAQNLQLALGIIEMILTLEPDAAYDIRDRGMIFQHIEYVDAALLDLRRYLELEPEAPDRVAIESFIESLDDAPPPTRQ